ncbi:hypothetical protein AB1K56_03370 [Microbacterium sp. BWR-S6Y]|uniref:hypothetical protein n=1 Tax=Microbacterium sp. BWR-S6Y TaxID=3232073 RepID=UPI00352818D1
MKINVNATARVQEALDGAQTTPTGRASTAGVYVARGVQQEACEAESALEAAGIPASLRKGVTVIAHQRTGTKKWTYSTSVIYLERGANDWFLTPVLRDRAGDERRVRVYPPTGFDYAAHAARVLRGAGMVA